MKDTEKCHWSLSSEALWLAECGLELSIDATDQPWKLKSCPNCGRSIVLLRPEDIVRILEEQYIAAVARLLAAEGALAALPEVVEYSRAFDAVQGAKGKLAEAKVALAWQVYDAKEVQP